MWKANLYISRNNFTCCLHVTSLLLAKISVMVREALVGKHCFIMTILANRYRHKQFNIWPIKTWYWWVIGHPPWSRLQLYSFSSKSLQKAFGVFKTACFRVTSFRMEQEIQKLMQSHSKLHHSLREIHIHKYNNFFCSCLR